MPDASTPADADQLRLSSPAGRWVLTAAVLGSAVAGFVEIERRSPHPLIPLDIFGTRQFTAANLVTFALYAALGSVLFLTAIVLQISVGLTPLQAGASLLPLTLIVLALSARAGALAARVGPAGRELPLRAERSPAVRPYPA